MPSDAPGAGSTGGEALTAPQIEATNGFVRVILGGLRNDGGVHAETAVAVAARLAGTSLLRSFDRRLDAMEAGAALFSDQADAETPALITTLHASLAALGLVVDATRLPPAVPAEHRPQLTLFQTQLMFDVPYRRTIKDCRLDQRQAAFAGAAATARIIGDCAPVLDPHVAVRIAVNGFVEGLKTVPIKVPGRDDDGELASNASAAGKRPWYRFW